MSEINHKEAKELALEVASNSNLARCYLEVTQQRDELLVALKTAVKFNSFREFNDYIPMMKKGIAKVESEK